MRNRMREELLCKKPRPTSEMLGCPVEFFKTYIEERFYGKMAWDNWGEVWELDHIIPCASFDLSNEEEARRCFHYSNFQPLIKTENRIKSDKITQPQQSLCLCHA